MSKVEAKGTPDGAATCSWYGRETDSLFQEGVTLTPLGTTASSAGPNTRSLTGAEARPEPGFGDEAFTDGQAIAGLHAHGLRGDFPLYDDAGVTASQVKPLRRVLDQLRLQSVHVTRHPTA